MLSDLNPIEPSTVPAVSRDPTSGSLTKHEEIDTFDFRLSSSFDMWLAGRFCGQGGPGRPLLLDGNAAGRMLESSGDELGNPSAAWSGETPRA